ncbi:hypothetical protein KA047_03530, partial [Candidatus Saccharibacteria bacterium]|nr:hypothetical protein [Candidatus Saccharibacteria bacterium]
CHAVEHPRTRLQDLHLGKLGELARDFDQLGVVEHQVSSGVDLAEDAVAIEASVQPVDLDPNRVFHLLELVQQDGIPRNVSAPDDPLIRVLSGHEYLLS